MPDPPGSWAERPGGGAGILRAAPGKFARPKVRGPASRRLALISLAGLTLVYVALAVTVATPGSRIVLAATERSPDWLLGPWRPLGASGADGNLAGPLFYTGLWIAMLAYVGVLVTARSVGARLAVGSIVAFHLLFLLAPPLLSQDAFSYISYARLGVLHSLSPYTHGPDAVPGDAAFVFAGSKDATSVYGPLFTAATYSLAKLSVPAALWTLKSVAALASLAVVALTWVCARRLGQDPVFAALVVGLNPLVLVHVVGGAHNDALVVGLWMSGVLAMIGATASRTPAAARMRERAGGALASIASGVKLSAGVVLPFIALGARRRRTAIVGVAAGALAVLAVSLAVFGFEAFDAFGLVGENQERTSRWSLPQRSADALGTVTGISSQTAIDLTRTAFAAGFLAVLALLLHRVWRTPDEPHGWLQAAGWATLALLVASAWLVPWYAIWLLPLAALAPDRRLLVGALTLCAYMLAIAVPL